MVSWTFCVYAFVKVSGLAYFLDPECQQRLYHRERYPRKDRYLVFSTVAGE